MFCALNNQEGKNVKIFLVTFLSGLHNKTWWYNAQRILMITLKCISSSIFNFSQNDCLTGLMKSSGFTARKSIVVWTLLSPGFLSLGVSFPFGVLVEDMLLNVEYFLDIEWKTGVISVKKMEKLCSLNANSHSVCLTASILAGVNITDHLQCHLTFPA